MESHDNSGYVWLVWREEGLDKHLELKRMDFKEISTNARKLNALWKLEHKPTNKHGFCEYKLVQRHEHFILKPGCGKGCQESQTHPASCDSKFEFGPIRLFYD